VAWQLADFHVANLHDFDVLFNEILEELHSERHRQDRTSFERAADLCFDEGFSHQTATYSSCLFSEHMYFVFCRHVDQ
jgi:hypothetical protein